MHPQNWVREKPASVRAGEKTHSRDGFRRVYSHRVLTGEGRQVPGQCGDSGASRQVPGRGKA